MKNKYPNGERQSRTCHVCGDSFRTRYRAAYVCPRCEAVIERDEARLDHHDAGFDGAASPNANALDVS